MEVIAAFVGGARAVQRLMDVADEVREELESIDRLVCQQAALVHRMWRALRASEILVTMGVIDALHKLTPLAAGEQMHGRKCLQLLGVVLYGTGHTDIIDTVTIVNESALRVRGVDGATAIDLIIADIDVMQRAGPMVVGTHSVGPIGHRREWRSCLLGVVHVAQNGLHEVFRILAETFVRNVRDYLVSFCSPGLCAWNGTRQVHGDDASNGHAAFPHRHS
mmetsp:Transcript_14725/g.40715  ORF Transcript_14725/g.40715 Transcript_14725/m.40715 type:complete len:221 (-) Transcript_14725:284-946(-)